MDWLGEDKVTYSRNIAKLSPAFKHVCWYFLVTKRACSSFLVTLHISLCSPIGGCRTFDIWGSWVVFADYTTWESGFS